jgi:U3 small nucleolar RNA-associated protein 21
VATWSSHNAKVNLLLLFGDHILSVDVESNMFIWSFKGANQNSSPFGHIMLDENFTPSCLVHPDTYLNKVTASSLFLQKSGCFKSYITMDRHTIYSFLE